MFSRSTCAVVIAAIALAAAGPARAADRFSFAVYGRGNPAVKVEVSAEGFRQTRDLAAEGRTSFDISGAPKTIYYWIEGCGTKRGGSYTVNGTVAARLDIDAHCQGSIASNQGNLR
jgi:hypothetical protein